MNALKMTDIEHAGATLDQLAFTEDSLKHLQKSIRGSGTLQKLQQTGSIQRTLALNDGTIEERVSYLENFVVDWLKEHRKHLQFNHSQHKCSETRLESLEALIADNADKCAKDIEFAQAKLKDLDKAVLARAKHDQLISLEAHMKSLEKSMTETADKLTNQGTAHVEHKELMKTHLECLETRMRDNVDTNTKEMAVANKRLGDCATHDQLASVEERMNSFAEFIGRAEDMLNEQRKGLMDCQFAHGRDIESIETRFDSLESLIDNNAVTYAKEIEEAKEKLAVVVGATHDDLAIVDERITSFEKFVGESTKARSESLETFASVEERIDSLEKSKATSDDKLTNLQTARDDLETARDDLEEWMKTRLESLEVLIGVNKEKIGHLDKALQDDILARVDTNSLQSSMAKTADELRSHQIAYEEYEKSMKCRLESLQALIDDNAGKYAKEVDVLKEKLTDVDKAIADCARCDGLTSIEQRITSFEQDVDKAIADCAKCDRLASIEQRLTSYEQEHIASFREHEEATKIRLDSFERLLEVMQTSAKDLKVALESLGDLDKATHDFQLANERMDSVLLAHEKSVKKLELAHGEHEESVKMRLDSLYESLAKEIRLQDEKHEKSTIRLDSHAKEVVLAHEKSVKKLELAHGEHQESVKTRLDSLYESLAKEIGLQDEKHEKSTVRLDSHAKEVVLAHEKSLKKIELAHGEHEESVKMRLDSLQILVSGSADKYTESIEFVKEKLRDLQLTIADCAKCDRLASVDQRITSFEQEHVASTVQRMRYLEKFIGVGEKLSDPGATQRISAHSGPDMTASGAQVHFSSLHERIINLERIGGLTAVKNAQYLKDYQCRDRDFKQSMEARLKVLEASIEDKTDKSAKEIKGRLELLENKLGRIQDAHAEFGDIDKVVAQCAQQDHGSLENRLEFLEKELGESVDKYERHKTSMENRLEVLETRIGESVKKHWKEIEAAKVKLDDIPKAISNALEDKLETKLASSKDLEDRISKPIKTTEESRLRRKELEEKLLTTQGKVESDSDTDDESTESDDDVVHSRFDQRIEKPSQCWPSAAIGRDDEKHAARQLHFEECESPSRTFAMLFQELHKESALHGQFEDTPGNSNILLKETPSTRAESQFEDTADLDVDTSDLLSAHGLHDRGQILGTWSSKDGSFCIFQLSSRLYFKQRDFTGDIEAMGDWLQVFIPGAGTIRMQIDERTGNHLRVQFKRNGESKWRREVRADRAVSLA